MDGLALRGPRVTAERLTCGIESPGLLNEVKDVNWHDCGLRRPSSRKAHCAVLKAHGVDHFGEVCPRGAHLHGVGNQVHAYMLTDCPKSLLVQDDLLYAYVMSKWISKRQARSRFQVARITEQQLYPAAQRHYDEHGTWPGDYLQAKHETARAFERFIDAGIISGITVEG